MIEDGWQEGVAFGGIVQKRLQRVDRSVSHRKQLPPPSLSLIPSPQPRPLPTTTTTMTTTTTTTRRRRWRTGFCCDERSSAFTHVKIGPSARFTSSLHGGPS